MEWGWDRRGQLHSSVGEGPAGAAVTVEGGEVGEKGLVFPASWGGGYCQGYKSLCEEICALPSSWKKGLPFAVWQDSLVVGVRRDRARIPGSVAMSSASLRASSSRLRLREGGSQRRHRTWYIPVVSWRLPLPTPTSLLRPDPANPYGATYKLEFSS